MAITWAPTGSAIITRTETAELTGTATITEDLDVYVTGSGTIDRRSVAAWAAETRRTCTRVLLGEAAEDLIRVSGPITVTLDEHGLIQTASFTVTDERCAYFHDDSIVVGGIPVSIRIRIGTDLAETDDSVFRGFTEAAPSSGSYVPTATIQCAGEGADWFSEKGCLYVQAFSGYTRLEILRAYAATVGIGADRIRGGEEWGIPKLGLDLSGLSPYELARRFARMEDCLLRLEAGVLVIIPAREVIGPAAVPVFDFDQGTLFAAAEEPPNRPVSRLVLSSVAVAEEILTGGTEETTAALRIETAPDLTRTETRTYTTTVNGVVVRRRIETWRDVAIPGVTPSAVAFRLWKLVETETAWGTVVVGGATLRTGRADSERTTTREWYSPPCRSSSGSVWSDGTRHLDSSATWQVTDDRITTYTYDEDCLLVSKVLNIGQWYSELVASGHTYDDGSIRADTSYQWIAPDAAQPWKRETEDSSEDRGDALRTLTVIRRNYGWDGAAVETWRAVTGRDDLWSSVPGSGVVWHAWVEYLEDGSKVEDAQPEAGPIPELSRASATIPQYRTEPIVLEAIADAGALLSEPVTETVWGAETMTDLRNVALCTFREARSPRYTVSHRANPHLLQYDVVGVTDPTWQHEGRVGYIAGWTATYDASTTGALDQEWGVVFPLPAFNPGTPLEVA